MQRQQTLGTFFVKPLSMKPAPPQQSGLSEFWGAKGKAKKDPKQTSSADTSKPAGKSTKAAKEDVASKKKAATAGSSTALPASDMEVETPTAPQAAVPEDEDEAPVRKRVTKRARVDSDEEGSDSGGAAVTRRLAKRKPAAIRGDDDDESSSPPAVSSAPPSSPPQDDPPSPPPVKKSNPKSKSSAPPPKSTKTTKKSTAAPKSSTTVPKSEASSPPPVAKSDVKEEDEEEIDPASASEEELAEDEEGVRKRKAKETASKTAELAMAKMKEVDFGWKDGETVPYAALTQAFSLIEATTKRLEITAILTAFLSLVIRRATAKTAPSKGKEKEKSSNGHEDVLQCVYLCINRLAPDYTGIELGIGESILVKAIGESTGRKVDVIKEELKKEGDLGLVAMNSRAMQKTLFKPKPLTLPVVFKSLMDIAKMSGNLSQQKKIGIITKLLAACQPDHAEAKYIIRSLEGKLRIRLAERTVLVALAQACVLAENHGDLKKWSKEELGTKCDEGADILKSVFSEIPSYDLVVPALLEGGMESLRDACKLTPGIPLKPMLAKPTKAIGEVLDKFEGTKFTCEYKYDGERAQVHMLEDGTVAVFSRNSEDMSKKYPDLVEQLPRCFKENTKSFVLDAEAVAIDKTTKKLLPFQELSRRKRKDVKIEDIQVRVCLFGFDLLYLNGESMLKHSLEERRKLLRDHFKEVDCEFAFAKSSDGETTEEIQVFLEESVKDGCEGLMVKTLTGEASFYEPSRRSVNWLKLKKDYLAGIGDSLDLVVVGGYYGKGKRTNFYGAFLLACYDPDAEEFQTICKIGTGFSDEALASHYTLLQPYEMSKPRGNVKVGGAKPDIWFEPKVVWEVLTADLSLSPIYEAARGLVDDRGISLRFPRFIRVRDDKAADDATEPSQIAEMYERQSLAQSGPGKKKGGAEDDFW
ncbi:ATP-dependent DNA ligase [Ceratobasidium sp. AG-I]|nr:ATP-dependent DNA ligase [Ceratobasidium sp. AG-I]